ncbi:MAG: AmmeMemoRadiSam system radical SAM enzyme [Bacteroidota bacterium]|nr:AmmeMemoRadiSam system radical SAM enzyme [Bacteroidota bacterium]
MEASYYKKSGTEKVQCTLCPHNCILSNGQTGICRVRTNINGQLIAETYQQVSSLSFDPIEKKPLYHFFPGSNILSVGSVGCNLRCSFCQNSEISQTSVAGFPYLKEVGVEQIISKALSKPENIGIAFTYNEPIVWIEFLIEIAKQAKSEGLQTAMVSNGFINPAPLQDLLPLIDAFNIDLKAFSEEFYKKYTSSKLAPVKETLKTIAKNGKHLEITNLLIPGANDSFAEFSEMINWIKNELGENIPLHLSRYFPQHKMNTAATSTELMLEYYEFAKSRLNYVYLGNFRGIAGSNSHCPACKKLVVNRSGYCTEVSGLDKTGKCIFCNHQVINNNYYIS